MKGYHDVGGERGGPVGRAEHEYEPWEKRVDAMMMLLSGQGPSADRIITVDELRRGIEGLGSAEYQSMSYYERWLRSMTNLLLEKGIVSPDELGAVIARLRERVTL